MAVDCAGGLGGNGTPGWGTATAYGATAAMEEAYINTCLLADPIAAGF